MNYFCQRDYTEIKLFFPRRKGEYYWQVRTHGACILNTYEDSHQKHTGDAD